MIGGQGIPDPWLAQSRSNNLDFPHTQQTHSENANIKKNVFQHLRGESYSGNFRDKPCFCCEKKFLFDCPDKVQATEQNAKDRGNLLNCPCLECHGKEKTTPVVCSQHCNCVPILQNWVLEHPRSRKCKHSKKRIPSDLSSSISSKYNADEESSTESLYPSNYLIRYCSCLPNKRSNIYFDYYNVAMPFRRRSRNQKGIYTDPTGQCDGFVKNNNAKSFLCPCLLNFKHTQRESHTKPEDANLMNSKEVQTDGNQPLRESKIIQTDKTTVLKCKADRNKCSCDVKWIGNNVMHYDSSNPVFNPQTGQSFAMCFSHPSLVCPYSHPSQFLIHRVGHKRKSKKEKKRCEVDKALQCNLLPTYFCGDTDSPTRTKPKEVLEIKNYLAEPEKGSSSCRPIIESFDFSKYLAEKRVQKFLEEKGFSPERKFDFQRKSYGMSTNRKRFEEERTSSQEIKPKNQETEMFRPVFHFKNHDFESLPQVTDCDSPHKDEYHDLNSIVPNSTRRNVQNENFKQVSPVRVNVLKQFNESRTYGLVGHCKSSCVQIKKRKKVNRKGRRKLLRVMYSRLERPPTSKKFPNSQQTDQTDKQRGEVSLKPVSFCAVDNNQKASRGRKALQFTSFEEGSSKKSFHTFTDARAGMAQKTINRHYEWNDEMYLVKSIKKPLKSELDFNNILQQISSHNSGSTWSSDTLKNIVDELLSERKTLECQNV